MNPARRFVAQPAAPRHAPRSPGAARAARAACSTRATQTGFGAIAAMVVVVLLALLSAAVTRFGFTQQMNVAQDLAAARALQAADAGTQYGLYQAFRGSWTSCAGASQTLDLRSDTGFYVTVTCSSDAYNEGEDPASPGTPKVVRTYVINAVACPSSSCPDNTRAAQPGYVERSRQVVATN